MYTQRIFAVDKNDIYPSWALSIMLNHDHTTVKLKSGDDMPRSTGLAYSKYRIFGGMEKCLRAWVRVDKVPAGIGIGGPSKKNIYFLYFSNNK